MEIMKRKSKKIETIYGSIAFLKICSSALNRLLVDKKIITKKELQQYFLKESKRYNKRSK